MPVIVLADGPTAATTGLDITECQVLARMEGTPEAHCLHILLIRLDAARWISVNPVLDVTVDDWTGVELTLVGRNAVLPLEGRPFLVHDRLDRVGLRVPWSRAFVLAENLGATAAGPVARPLAGPAGWFYADTSQASFGAEVPIAMVADPTSAKLAATVGVLRLGTDNWVHIERVRLNDVGAWRAARCVAAALISVAEPAVRAPQPL